MIKDCKRDLRSDYQERGSQYQITGPNLRRPSNWLNALQFDQFKVTINTFLISVWQNDSLAETFQWKCFYVNDGGICYCFGEENGQVTRILIPELTSSHKEADSKMVYHLTFFEEKNKVIIRTSDTNMLVIALGCLEHIPESINLWFEVGFYDKNSLRYIDVRIIFNKLGKDLCRAFPAFYVYTGSDHTATFSRKGKTHPLKILEKDKTVQTVFGNMGFSDDIQEEKFKVIEKVTCALYGKPKFNSVNEARLELFLKKYQPKKKEVVISCGKKMEGSFLPPCASVLQQKMNSTNHTAGKVFSSWTSHTPISNPLNCGWELSNGHWKFNGLRVT